MPPFLPYELAERVLVVAHRGASRAARENTVEAFAKAGELGADGVELDARRTADGAIVVHHNAHVEGVGTIVELDAATLRSRAPWIPTLSEALEACDGLWVNIEIKNIPIDPDWDPDERIAVTVTEMVAETPGPSRTLLSSFNPHTLERVREVDARMPTALVTLGAYDPFSALDAASQAGDTAVHPGVTALAGEQAEAVVERARTLGLTVVPWTVNDPGEVRRLGAAGVGGVVTDVPDVIRSVAETASDEGR